MFLVSTGLFPRILLAIDWDVNHSSCALIKISSEDLKHSIIRKYTCIFLSKHRYIYTYLQTHTYMHTHTQTHTPLVSALFSLDNSLMYHSTMSYRKFDIISHYPDNRYLCCLCVSMIPRPSGALTLQCI